jgi:hypothetical protein
MEIDFQFAAPTRAYGAVASSVQRGDVANHRKPLRSDIQQIGSDAAIVNITPDTVGTHQYSVVLVRILILLSILKISFKNTT